SLDSPESEPDVFPAAGKRLAHCAFAVAQLDLLLRCLRSLLFTTSLHRAFWNRRKRSEQRMLQLPSDLVLYLARHECGTKVCREKGFEGARRLPGHANISTTQRYLHLDDRELAAAQDLLE